MESFHGKYKIRVADPYITEDDISAVAEALRRKCLSEGEYVKLFENEFARYVGTKHAIAVSNGTTALHAALAALEIGRGDEVIVPSFSFIATANCVLYQGARPIFTDIDPLTLNIDPEKILAKVGEKTKAIVAVHYAGHPAEMNAIVEIAEEHNIPLIEDAAEATGSLYKERKVGSLGNMACFSFYPNKNITTGEGGMITTDEDDLGERIRMIKSHGQDRRYHHITLGYNYRMTDFQAALGLVQLRRLEWVIDRKIRAAEYYSEIINKTMGDLVKTPYVAPYAKHTFMFYSVLFKDKTKRNHVLDVLEKSGVETRIAFPPIHLQPLYRKIFGYQIGYLPITEDVADRVLSLPIYPHIGFDEQNYVLEKLRESMR